MLRSGYSSVLIMDTCSTPSISLHYMGPIDNSGERGWASYRSVRKQRIPSSNMISSDTEATTSLRLFCQSHHHSTTAFSFILFLSIPIISASKSASGRHITNLGTRFSFLSFSTLSLTIQPQQPHPWHLLPPNLPLMCSYPPTKTLIQISKFNLQLCTHKYCTQCTANGQYLHWRCWCRDEIIYLGTNDDIRDEYDWNNDTCLQCHQVRDSTSGWEWERTMRKEDVWSLGRWGALNVKR